MQVEASRINKVGGEASAIKVSLRICFLKFFIDSVTIQDHSSPCERNMPSLLVNVVESRLLSLDDLAVIAQAPKLHSNAATLWTL